MQAPPDNNDKLTSTTSSHFGKIISFWVGLFGVFFIFLLQTASLGELSCSSHLGQCWSDPATFSREFWSGNKTNLIQNQKKKWRWLNFLSVNTKFLHQIQWVDAFLKAAEFIVQAVCVAGRPVWKSSCRTGEASGGRMLWSPSLSLFSMAAQDLKMPDRICNEYPERRMSNLVCTSARRWPV